MRDFSVKPCKPFKLVIDSIAPDKSISHRCAMFSLLSDKPSRVRNFLQGEDTLNSLKIAQQLGARVEENGNEMVIHPPGNLTEPDDVLDCGNAGTGMRLYTGFLAGVDGFFVLSGDKYLRKRPMKRVAEPLRNIGAQIDGRENGNLAPLSIRGKTLTAFDYESKIASAQVKSAMILAGLRGDGTSYYKEPELTRDHTERMLKGMGAKLGEADGKIVIEPLSGKLAPLDITVPADPSSGFFFAVAAAVIPGSEVTIRNVLLNETRTEAYKMLRNMGADVDFQVKENTYETIGDIVIRHNELKGIEVSENMSWLIDELPALSIAMAMAKGKSTVKNAHELRVKESDRIASVVSNLQKCGIEVEEFEDGYCIEGGRLNSSEVTSFGDHRLAMSFAIAGLVCGMKIIDTECIMTSFPNFTALLEQITEIG